jgi:hypothetical protein
LGLTSMPDVETRAKAIKTVLDALAAALSDLDALEAPIAAAYVDCAMSALCRQFALPSGYSTTDIVG